LAYFPPPPPPPQQALLDEKIIDEESLSHVLNLQTMSTTTE
jgi:hypothetical protein